MPFKLELTWISHAKKWRKRYLGQTYYLKTKVNGKKDREGYLEALDEWKRLKEFLDGLGPNPYTSTGALVPKGRFLPESQKLQSVEPARLVEASEDDPPWMVTSGIFAGLHPELIVKTPPILHAEERRISALVEKYLANRRQEAERGNLSLKQYDEDKRQTETFRNFLNVNYPTLVFVDQLSPECLNLYRDKQNELCGSTITLKKRLSGVRKWLLWLVDQNILRELPKDMTTYAKVKYKRPSPTFFTVEQVKEICGKATGLLKACVMLGLNAGFTQQDCSTLTAGMIDWDSGILSRDRNKTGCQQSAKLWPETLEALRKVGQFEGGLFLVTPAGSPLVVETVNPKNGKVVKIDHVQKQWAKLSLELGGMTFKHLRKTSADHVEKWNPNLTGLFLAHSESQVKRYYVGKHFEELYLLTDKLRELYKLNEVAA